MRVWKDGTFDDWEHIEITADGATVWTSDELEHSCTSMTGWTNMVLSEVSCHDDSYTCYIDVELVIEHTASTLIAARLFIFSAIAHGADPTNVQILGAASALRRFQFTKFLLSTFS